MEKNIDENDTNAFRYCGEYYDAETGTIYLRARYYDPSIGRFISRDSYAGKLNDPLSLNLYTYCHNNPITGVDPNGHWPKWLDNITNTIKKEATDLCNDLKEDVKTKISQIEKNVKSEVKSIMTCQKTYVDKFQNWLGEHDFTSSLGVSAGAGAGYASASLSGSLTVDSKGNIALQGSFGLGATTSPVTYSLGINGSITNAPDYTKLEGNGFTLGGSGVFPIPPCPVVGVGASADLMMIPEEDNDWKYTGGMATVLIGSPGFEGHMEYSNTATADIFTINVFDDYNKIYEKVISWANN